MSSTFWDQRYAGEELVYGEASNEFLAGMADRLPVRGQALDIGAGEGRNALFLASRGRSYATPARNALDRADRRLRNNSSRTRI